MFLYVLQSIAYTGTIKHNKQQRNIASVRMFNFLLSKTFALKQAKVPEPLPMRLLTSVLNGAFDVRFEIRYTKCFHIFDVLVINFY